MKVFEFIFNPKLKKDLVFDSFCYKPENIYEKEKGHLCMMGLLKNALPTNIYLIKKIARTIKDKYFRSIDSNLQDSFKRGLKVVNDFLSKKADQGNTSWLGNLSFLALSLKKRELIFSKTGDIKVLVVRDGQIIDIDEKTKYNEVSPYPVKVFARTISSKLAKKDLILVFTREVYNFFKKKNLLEKVIKPSYFKEKKIKKLLNKRKKQIAEVKGVFLGISLKESQKEASKTTLKKLKDVPWKKMFSSFWENLKKKEFPEIKLPAPKQKPKIKAFNKGLSLFTRKIKPFFTSKKILFIIPIVLLLLGLLFFNFQKNQKVQQYQEDLAQIENQIEEANNLYNSTSSESIKRANDLFQESWSQLSTLKNDSKDLSKNLTVSIENKKRNIQSKLYELNNVTSIKEPDLFFDFSETDFSPKNLLTYNEKLYFYNPNSKNVLTLTKDKKDNLIQVNKKIKDSTTLSNSPLLLSQSDQVITLKNNFPTYHSLVSYKSDFSFDHFSSFGNHIYFLNNKTGEIIKYPYLGSFQWGSPQSWLSSESLYENNIEAESFTIDQSIWVLNENTIYRYYTGELKDKIQLDLFPTIKSLSKIYTSPELSNIYILEPEQKRVIVINKSGEVIKQYRSDKFENLSDLTVTNDEKILYLLSGFKLFKISL